MHGGGAGGISSWEDIEHADEHIHMHGHDHDHDHDHGHANGHGHMQKDHGHHHQHHHHHSHAAGQKVKGKAQAAERAAGFRHPEEEAEERALREEEEDEEEEEDWEADRTIWPMDQKLLAIWLEAMGSALVVSLCSLICLTLLPLVCYKGKLPRALVDGLAAFGAGAMLGDAFLHQLPHAFGSGSHSHNHTQSHDHGHAHPHGHGHESHSHDHGHDHGHEEGEEGMRTPLKTFQSASQCWLASCFSS
ncbi:hypothetical protein CLOP_g1614 [Closterium sp. NIES-67]|nr:hypothetical protein CLOP_g1614 [Closterium sp. NIES-67]